LILTLDELDPWREQWRQQGQSVVWTNGCFDVLHVGHVRSLQQAKSLGSILVVGLNDDASVRELKGPNRPIFPAAERAEMLDALRAVDVVVLFSDRVPLAAVARVQPDVYCKGDDYRDADLPEAEVVHGYGGRVEFLTFVPQRSTSEVLTRIDGATLGGGGSA
jgi:rfaE bifunctional protein nucleotidyltransferase chain/domain